MSKPTNRDQDSRDKILSSHFDDNHYLGGIKRFTGISVATLQELVNKGFADTNERQQPDTPSIREFLELAKDFPTATFNGYAVGKHRRDYGVVIDMIKCAHSVAFTPADMIRLMPWQKTADRSEVTLSTFYFWWD